jgi:CRP-like cAMP-binding protein
MAAIDRSLLVNLPLFADLPAGDLDDLLADAVPVRFSKGAHIFEQGGEAHSFFVLLHGHVRAEKTTPDGEQIVVRYVAPGEAFGIAQALRLKQYPATAIAVVDCLVITWPAGAWQRLAGKYPRLAANTLQMVGNRLQEEHAAYWKSRLNSWTGGSPAPCCGWRSGRDEKRARASKSTFPSAGRTSPR